MSERVDPYKGRLNGVDNVEVNFPKDPRQRFERLFPALGNSIGKSLTLLLLGNMPKSAGQLHREFVDVSGGVWRTGHLLQADYCRYTLEPIGLVARADFIPDGSDELVIGYRRTEAGLKYGVPIATHNLIERKKDQAKVFYTLR